MEVGWFDVAGKFFEFGKYFDMKSSNRNIYRSFTRMKKLIELIKFNIFLEFHAMNE